MYFSKNGSFSPPPPHPSKLWSYLVKHFYPNFVKFNKTIKNFSSTTPYFFCRGSISRKILQKWRVGQKLIKVESAVKSRGLLQLEVQSLHYILSQLETDNVRLPCDPAFQPLWYVFHWIRSSLCLLRSVWENVTCPTSVSTLRSCPLERMEAFCLSIPDRWAFFFSRGERKVNCIFRARVRGWSSNHTK